MKNLTIKRMVCIATFAALSFVLYLGPKFPLPFFPSFLEINFSMLPIIICAFMLGPIDAAICVLVRFAVKLPLSSTGFIGETADLMIGMVTALSSGIVYHHVPVKHKTLLAFITVVISWVLAGIASNAWFNIPMYSRYYTGYTFSSGYKVEDGYMFIVNACKDAFKLISFGTVTDVNGENFLMYYLLLAVLPFNLLISIVISSVTALVHLRLRKLYDMIGVKKEDKEEDLSDFELEEKSNDIESNKIVNPAIINEENKKETNLESINQ